MPQDIQGQCKVEHMSENKLAGFTSTVYGGGTIGLVGEIAKTLVSINGPQSVHGIIPVALIEYRRDGLDLHGYVPEEATFGRPTVVKDMPASKKLTTAEILAGGPGSGFIGLSGGLGTMKEILR
ncbi:hypothetical protein ACHAQI_005575 [Fusarium lateritium]